MTSPRFRIVVLVVSLVVLHTVAEPRAATRLSRTWLSTARARKSFCLPAVFEPNVGQSASRVGFLYRTPAYTIFLAPTGTVLSFHVAHFDLGSRNHGSGSLKKISRQESVFLSETSSSRSILNTRFLGGNPSARPVGERRLQGKSNYFNGHDPTRWRRNVAQYGQIRYPSIYPGIDLAYHGNEGQLEYDFLLAPGASPESIQFAVDGGPDSLQAKLTEDGNLNLAVGGNTVLLHTPKFYQGKGCISKQGSEREFVKTANDCNFLPGGRFELRRHKREVIIGFAVPPYDHREPLVIDPVLSFSTFLGGSTGASTNGVAVDAAGNIYVAGTGGADFPTTPGVYQPAPKDLGDVVIFKLSPDGSHLIYSTHLGGSVGEGPTGIAVDATGNAYVTGVTASPDFPTVNQIGPLPLRDNAFVSKLSPDGSSLLYSTLIGGNLEGSAKGIAVDATGEAVIAGRTYSTDYPTTPGVIEPAQPVNGNESGFVTKISSDGKSFVFSTYLGANSGAEGLGVASDSVGDVYVTGYAASNFAVTPGAFQSTCLSPPVCGYVVKINPTGTALLYSGFLSGAQGRAIAVNSTGNAYVTGVTYTGEPFPTTPGVFQPQSGGFEDAFVTEISADGSSLVYSTYLGGQNGEMGEAIAVDSGGNVSVTGETSSFDFPTQGAVQPTYAGDGDAFLSILNSSGSQLLFSTFLGGTYTEYAEGVAVDPIGNTYFVGGSTSSDFPIVNALQPALPGLGAAVILKVTNQPDFTITASQPLASVSAGQTATYGLTLTPENGFNQSVTLSCKGQPAGSTCTVSPTTVTLTGSSSASATVNIRTTARNAALKESIGSRAATSLLGSLSLMFAAGLILPLGRRGGRWFRNALAFAVVTTTLFGSQGCGGGSSTGGAPTPSGSYLVTITGSGPNNLNHPAQLGLIVN